MHVLSALELYLYAGVCISWKTPRADWSGALSRVVGGPQASIETTHVAQHCGEVRSASAIRNSQKLLHLYNTTQIYYYTLLYRHIKLPH